MFKCANCFRKKKNRKRIFIEKNNSCDKIITITEKSTDIHDEEYWFSFYTPSHDLIDMDDKLCEVLKYKKEEIIGENFQEFLITPILKKYANILLHKTEKTIRGMRTIGDKLAELRFIPLLTKHKQIIWITNFYPIVKLNSMTNREHIFTIKVLFNIECNNSIAPNIPNGFMKYLTSPVPTFCVKNFRRCIIIMMDIANSTGISTQKTPTEVALMFHEVIKISICVIDYEFYPFIRFIEACGDSLLFLHCPKLSLSLSDIHSECIYFALTLTEKLNKILKLYDTYIRCGVVAGECAGGVWDGKTFRLSGKNVNLAARLESICKKNNIVIEENMYQALLKEKYSFDNFEETYEDLKGLGVHTVYNINLGDETVKKNVVNIRKSINN